MLLALCLAFSHPPRSYRCLRSLPLVSLSFPHHLPTSLSQATLQPTQRLCSVAESARAGNESGFFGETEERGRGINKQSGLGKRFAGPFRQRHSPWPMPLYDNRIETLLNKKIHPRSMLARSKWRTLPPLQPRRRILAHSKSARPGRTILERLQTLRSHRVCCCRACSKIRIRTTGHFQDHILRATAAVTAGTAHRTREVTYAPGALEQPC